MGVPVVAYPLFNAAGQAVFGSAAATAAVSPKTVNPAAFKSTNPVDPKIAAAKEAREKARSNKKRKGGAVASLSRAAGRSLGGADAQVTPSAPSVLGG